MKIQRGFTLVELQFVVMIIGILAGIAIPNFIAYRNKTYAAEAYYLIDVVKQDVMQYYDWRGELPLDNKAIGLPPPANIRGKQVSQLTVSHGVIAVEFYPDSLSSYVSIILSPTIDIENPYFPILWEEKKINRK